jgi:DNA-binding XRE family transcriptional regulator
MDEIMRKLTWNKKIEVLRIAKGWTQEETANKCCTSAKTYWNWEKGTNYPRKISKRAIAQTFGLTVEEIFGANESEVN